MKFQVKINKKQEVYLTLFAENANQAIILANQWLHQQKQPMVAHKAKVVKD